MRRWVNVFIILIYFFSCSLIQTKTVASHKVPKSSLICSYFTENIGQWDSRILFVGYTSSGRIALTKDSVYYQVTKFSSIKGGMEECTIRQNLDDSSSILIKGVDVLPYYNNYFIGSDPSKWATNCRNFRKLTIQNLKTGMELLTDDPLRYSTLIGSSQEDDFAYATTLDSSGNVLVAGETYSSDFPILPGVTKTTNKGSGDGVIFKLDPTGTMLLYSTYLGGSGNDYIRSIALDPNGNIYVTGTTDSANFPCTEGVIQNKLKGTSNTFITKLTSNGGTVLFSTYLGGSEDDYGYGIGVDSSGNSYITGTTGSLNFPTTTASYHSKNKGAYDVFVTKLNPSGSMLLYSAILGGVDYDYARGIKVDSSGSAYITGSTGSFDFPVSSKAYQSKLKGLGNAFVLKLSPSGGSIIFSTFLGGSYYDYSYGIQIDDLENAYVTGTTGSFDFPVSVGAYQPKSKENNDVFVAKLSSTGSNLLYSTYLGGSGGETASAITIDEAYNAYVCGSTDSSNFPISQGSFQSTKNGGQDAFVSKLSPKGSLLYSSYLGSSWDDDAYGITIDSSNNMIICGETKGADFPITKGAYWNNQSGESDMFVTKLSTSLKTKPDQSNPLILELWIGYRIALVDGDLQFLDTVPLLVNNTSMVPLRFIAESLHANVFFKAKTQEIDIILGSSDITLWINKPIAQIESIHKDSNTYKVVILDVSPFIRNDRTLVPVRFISETFGAVVSWSSKDQKITIKESP